MLKVQFFISYNLKKVNYVFNKYTNLWG